jgi:hypothetical protein
MSDGVAEITREFTTLGEHCDEKDQRRVEYIFSQSAVLLEQDNGWKRDIGHEGMTLEDFLNHADARKAELTTAHVLALRLYTSNSYYRINDPLRDGCTEASPHPYAATTFYIHDGIMKLRAIRATDATAVRTFWRGMDDMGVTQSFLRQGGTELAPMSTTGTLAVARKFAKVGEKPNPLLLKVEAGNMYNCGADVQWLSMYPAEKEVLFPPLTYMKATHIQGAAVGTLPLECTIITVTPRFYM